MPTPQHQHLSTNTSVPTPQYQHLSPRALAPTSQQRLTTGNLAVFDKQATTEASLFLLRLEQLPVTIFYHHQYPRAVVQPAVIVGCHIKDTMRANHLGRGFKRIA